MNIEVKNSLKPIDYAKSMKVLEERANDVFLGKKDEFWVVAIENSIDSKNWHEIDYKGKVLIVVGSEGRGIKKINLDNCDFQSTIPMQGKTNSLNVSAAVSAIAFERLRQITSN